jgi:lipid-A-disaccharide synthase
VRILISTGEVSGDVAGALLTRAIRAERPDAVIDAIGGPHMESAGARVRYSSSHLGTVGVTEAFSTLPSFARAFGTMRAIVRDERPDLAVLIGNDLFHVLVGRWLRAHGVRTVAYFPPQTWIWRSLARQIAGSFDAMLTSFPGEQAVYERASRGTKVSFVGHYLSEVLERRTPASKQAARVRLGLSDGSRLVSLMPGSRAHEVRRLLPVLAAAARLLHDDDPTLRFVMPIADERFRSPVERELARAAIAARVTLVRGPSHDAMIAADLLILASGTASLEAAVLGVPMVIVYKVSTLTYGVVRACIRLGLFESDTVGLPNLVLGRRAVPELIQRRATSSAVAAQAAAILRSPRREQEIVDALAVAARQVSGGRTLQRAAHQLIEWTRSPVHETPDDRAAANTARVSSTLDAPVPETK